MLNLSKIRFPHIRKATKKLSKAMNQYIEEKVVLPGGLNYFVFEDSFLDSSYYLIFLVFRDISLDEPGHRYNCI